MISNSLENLHPTIVNDMRTFDNVETERPTNVSSIWDVPLETYPPPDGTYPESTLFNVDHFSSAPGPFPSGPYQGGGHAPHSAARPAVLDAGWQVLLEQLGFS